MSGEIEMPDCVVEFQIEDEEGLTIGDLGYLPCPLCGSPLSSDYSDYREVEEGIFRADINYEFDCVGCGKIFKVKGRIEEFEEKRYQV